MFTEEPFDSFDEFDEPKQLKLFKVEEVGKEEPAATEEVEKPKRGRKKKEEEN